MIAARQIAFGKGAGAKKPYDAEIEYLESTGTQYIDTGTLFLNGDVYDFKFEITGLVEYGYIHGVNWRDDGGTSRFFGLRRLAVTGYFQGQTLSVPNNTIPYETGVVYIAHIVKSNENYIASSDGRRWDWKGPNNTISSNQPIYLFAVNNNGNPAYQNKIRLFSYKITRDGEVILDLIPVRVGSVGYMYDRVSGRLFGNDGTGEFVLGPDI